MSEKTKINLTEEFENDAAIDAVSLKKSPIEFAGRENGKILIAEDDPFMLPEPDATPVGEGIRDPNGDVHTAEQTAHIVSNLGLEAISHADGYEPGTYPYKYLTL